uniref:Uncharacterized protein n=1 Tax=Rhizophora mucronata TaxID=61149 RepID=A0A2P2PB10_RHIMU
MVHKLNLNLALPTQPLTIS